MLYLFVQIRKKTLAYSFLKVLGSKFPKDPWLTLTIEELILMLTSAFFERKKLQIWPLRLPTVRETRVQSLCWEDLLEKEIVTHSSTLAWIIPWMEERGRLQTMGSLRVRQDWATALSRPLQPISFPAVLKTGPSQPQRSVAFSIFFLPSVSSVFCWWNRNSNLLHLDQRSENVFLWRPR